MMVILHTIMKYMHVLSKRFSHAGQVNWRDDLDLESFGKNLVYKMQELISGCKTRTEER